MTYTLYNIYDNIIIIIHLFIHTRYYYTGIRGFVIGVVSALASRIRIATTVRIIL